MKQVNNLSAHNLIHNNAVPLTIIAVTLVLAVGGSTASHWFRYDRDAIMAGELWRLITGHFVHLGWKHFFMNIAGLILIWVLFGRLLTTWKWAVCILVSALFISIGLIVLNPELRWYVGLSGVLHGMFVCGAIASIAMGYRAEVLLLVLLIAKLVWEQLQGAIPGSAAFAGGDVVVDAHLYGAIIGVVCAAFLVRKPWAKPLPPS
jgi:rhomboid family GlyGly-CTERM serine protease